MTQGRERKPPRKRKPQEKLTYWHVVKCSYVSKAPFAICAVNIGGNSVSGFAADSLRFSVMTQDFHLLRRQRLLRPYSGRISIFHDKRPCLAPPSSRPDKANISNSQHLMNFVHNHHSTVKIVCFIATFSVLRNDVVTLFLKPTDLMLYLPVLPGIRMRNSHSHTLLSQVQMLKETLTLDFNFLMWLLCISTYRLCSIILCESKGSNLPLKQRAPNASKTSSALPASR